MAEIANSGFISSQTSNTVLLQFSFANGILAPSMSNTVLLNFSLPSGYISVTGATGGTGGANVATKRESWF